MRKREKILHKGEMVAQQRFSPDQIWPERALNQMFGTTINSSMKGFLESQSFFFIATASDDGKCDASFRSTEVGEDMQPQPAVHIPEPALLIFPDYSGNNLFNSLGNILVNPNIGMIFIDFANAIRARVNGTAAIIENSETHSDIWSTAHRYIEVTVEQAYWNCPQRIPKLNPEMNFTRK